MNTKWITTLALVLAPSLAAAQSSDSTKSDSASQKARSGRIVVDTARGAIERPASAASAASRTWTPSASAAAAMAPVARTISLGTMGLNQEQLERLQGALRADGCYSGDVSGVADAQTQKALQCSREKRGLTGSANLNEHLQAMYLDFSVAERPVLDRASTQKKSKAVQPN